MTIYSYVVRWDHGFAPNPFHGTCTVATCKPKIRKRAIIGDWVIGTGPSGKYSGKVIFMMQVAEKLSFDQYWDDPRFMRKRPVMNGSLKQRFGDNIYRHGPDGAWVQADSRHSWDDEENAVNLKRDTGDTDQILVANVFCYWGENAPALPKKLAMFSTHQRGHKYDYPEKDCLRLIDWYTNYREQGQLGDPIAWQGEKRWK